MHKGNEEHRWQREAVQGRAGLELTWELLHGQANQEIQHLVTGEPYYPLSDIPCLDEHN